MLAILLSFQGLSLKLDEYYELRYKCISIKLKESLSLELKYKFLKLRLNDLNLDFNLSLKVLELKNEYLKFQTKLNISKVPSISLRLENKFPKIRVTYNTNRGINATIEYSVANFKISSSMKDYFKISYTNRLLKIRYSLEKGIKLTLKIEF